MKLVSFNVNGLRAILGKGFVESIAALDPDVLVLQETKYCDPLHLSFPLELPGYELYWTDSKLRKG